MTYFNHHTVNTGHNRRSARSEVSDAAVAEMRRWLDIMRAGEPLAVIDDVYSCELLAVNNSLADFIIGYHDSKMRQFDVIRFVVCLHSRYKRKAWEIVEGEGEPPHVPFIAARIINPMYVHPDLSDFERCIAWAFFESRNNDKKDNSHNR